MIELTREEYDSLWCQNGTLEHGRGEHSKYLPFAFTENGVAMLRSECANGRYQSVISRTRSAG